MEFLSERNLELHKEYLNNLILRYGIFEKSYPNIKGKELGEIYRMKLKYSEREEAAALLEEILAHKIFFSSFKEKNMRSARICAQYGSEASFLYELLSETLRCDAGFLTVYEEKGKILFYCGREYGKVLREKKVKLALDVCEHSYFLDYGFDKKSYVLNSLSCFDFGKV